MSVNYLFVVLVIAGLATAKPYNSIEVPVVGNSGAMCKLPAWKGHCRALIPRWRYDPEIGDCRQFKFGGCDSNGNNFRTYSACMDTCKGVE